MKENYVAKRPMVSGDVVVVVDSRGWLAHRARRHTMVQSSVAIFVILHRSHYCMCFSFVL